LTDTGGMRCAIEDNRYYRGKPDLLVALYRHQVMHTIQSQCEDSNQEPVYAIKLSIAWAKVFKIIQAGCFQQSESQQQQQQQQQQWMHHILLILDCRFEPEGGMLQLLVLGKHCWSSSNDHYMQHQYIKNIS
jgi:hypothetical protein